MNPSRVFSYKFLKIFRNSYSAQNLGTANTEWKVSKYGVISGPSTGKYGPETTLYLDTFHAV